MKWIFNHKPRISNRKSQIANPTPCWLALLVALTVALPCSANDSHTTFFMGRLLYGDNDGRDCSGVGHDLMELVSKTSTLQVQDERRIHLTDPALFDTPFVFMNGHYNFVLSDAELSDLRKYLDHGGFVFASGCCSEPGFPKAWRREFSRIFPHEEVRSVPPRQPDLPLVLQAGAYPVPGPTARCSIGRPVSSWQTGGRHVPRWPLLRL